MEKLKKYKTQIFNGITIFLIVTFVIYPGLTTANTLLNVLSGIGFLLLLVWGALALYQYVTSDSKSEFETIKEQEWKEHITKQMEAMNEMHKQNESLKKKTTKPKTNKTK